MFTCLLLGEEITLYNPSREWQQTEQIRQDHRRARCFEKVLERGIPRSLSHEAFESLAFEFFKESGEERRRVGLDWQTAVRAAGDDGTKPGVADYLPAPFGLRVFSHRSKKFTLDGPFWS